MESFLHLYSKKAMAKQNKSKVNYKVFAKKYKKKIKRASSEYHATYKGNKYVIDVFYLTEENEKIYIEIIVKNQLEIYRKILDMPKENTYVLDLTKLDLNSSPKDIEVYLQNPSRYYTLEEYIKRCSVNL